MLRERRIWLPWSLAAIIMYGLSYVWHGIALNDLEAIKVPLALYFSLSALVYVIVALVLVFAMHQALAHGWISLRRGFPLMGMLLGAAVGFLVYLIAFIFGISFMDHKLSYIVVDVTWQMVEQGMGGLMVSLGIIYDLHKKFLESERAN